MTGGNFAGGMQISFAVDKQVPSVNHIKPINLCLGTSMYNLRKTTLISDYSRRLAVAGVVLALASACGGGGGGGDGVAAPPQQTLPIAVTTPTGSALISNTGGVVAINGNTIVELSAGASTLPVTVTALLRPSTTGGLTNEVVVDLSAAVPSDTAASEVMIYIYPTSVKQATVGMALKANASAANSANALSLASSLDTFTFAGSTTPYTLDQLDIVGTTGSSITLRASQLVYDTVKGAIRAKFISASTAITTVKAASGAAREFIVNVKAKNNDNTARLYHFPNLASSGTEAAPAVAETKIPMILVHGIQLFSEGCGSNSGYKTTWNKFRTNFFGDAEIASKYELYSFSYPTNLDFKTNGASFSKKISAVFGNKPVVVVAHSMGGLVTRAADVYYSTKAQSGNATDINIARVITLDTPHHGTPYINGAAAVSELLCVGDAQAAGGPSLAWDDLENNGSCTNSGNPVLCDLNSPQNLQHLKKYVLYSAHGVLGTFVSYAGTNVAEYPWLLNNLTNAVYLLKTTFSQAVIDNYFSSDVAKKSDIAVLLPSQRLMSYVNNQWTDNPRLFADLPDAYPSTYHIDISESNPGVAGSTKVWAKKADGTPGGVRGHLNEFALQIAGKPDLIPSAVTTTPASVQPSASVNVSWRITNSGNANAAASTTGLRLVSAATTGNGTAANHLINVPTGALAVGGVANQSQAITIPAGTAPGSYVVVVAVDNVATSTMGQSNVANDYARSAPFTVAASLPPTPTPTPTGRLPDTGITANQCYAAGSNALVICASATAIALSSQQDGMVGRDVAGNDNSDGKAGFSYTKIGANGEVLAASATTWSCVKDNITGLMWEVKTADGGLRDWTKTYTNYDSTTALQINGTTAPTQAQIDAATNSVGFKNAVNSASLCGASDWRLPTADELQGIVDYGVAYPGPTIDATWFPNTQGSWFWSSSPDVDYAYGSWNVSFYVGLVNYGSYRYHSVFVRLVRAGQ